MKTVSKIALLSLALEASSASVPRAASACSCVSWTTRQELVLESVKALDGGEVGEEAAFWPTTAELVHAGSDDSLNAESLEIILTPEQP